MAITDRLRNELAILDRCARSGQRVALTVAQLVADEDRPLPDAIPPAPTWVGFEWPVGGEVNYESYWRQVDRGGWRGEYL